MTNGRLTETGTLILKYFTNTSSSEDFHTNKLKVEKKWEMLHKKLKGTGDYTCHCIVCVTDEGADVSQATSFSSLCHCSHDGIPSPTLCNASVSVHSRISIFLLYLEYFSNLSLPCGLGMVQDSDLRTVDFVRILIVAVKYMFPYSRLLWLVQPNSVSVPFAAYMECPHGFSDVLLFTSIALGWVHYMCWVVSWKSILNCVELLSRIQWEESAPADRASLLTSWLRQSTNGMLVACMDFCSLSLFFSCVNVLFLFHLFSDRLVNKLFGVAITGHRRSDVLDLLKRIKTAMAEHVLDSDNKDPHEINWSEVTILDHAKHTRERKVREAFQIEKKNPGMNRDRGIAKSRTWNAIVWTVTETWERCSLGYVCTFISNTNNTVTRIITCTF